MMFRIRLLPAETALLAFGLLGGVLGPAWLAPPAPSGLAPGVAARIALEAKELHLANAWAAIDRRRAGRARRHARAALARAPASGYGWLALGWAEMLAGRDAPALLALRRSWQWAPNLRNLALRRVILASVFWPVLSPGERGRVVAELRLARQQDMAYFGRLVAHDRRLAALWRIARARGLDRSAFPKPGRSDPRPP